jgi:hypothetical protein
MAYGISCTVCGQNIRDCICADVTENLRGLVNATHVFVGNIIEERIEKGLSKAEDFAGLNIWNPFSSKEEFLASRTGTGRTAGEEIERIKKGIE